MKRTSSYFRSGAASFDAIYTGRKARLAAWLDRVLRWDMRARFEETMKECGDVSGFEILDVGCGSGRYVVELAKRGARLTGVDSSAEMLGIARGIAGREGVGEMSTFLQGDFLTVDVGGRFAITLAIGFFDYTDDCIPYLLKMRDVTRDKLITTFPRFWTWRAPLRKLRLAAKGVPVYFYTARKVKARLRESGWEPLKMRTVGKLHFVVARPCKTDRRKVTHGRRSTAE
jgi:SAM-dependent methyltransferase